MKLLTYYLVILLPIPSLYWAAKFTSPLIFVAALLFYSLLYRPLVDGFRLMDLGLLSKAERWKVFFASPYYHLKYFRQLYFSNTGL
jgi:hypothetical protein